MLAGIAGLQQGLFHMLWCASGGFLNLSRIVLKFSGDYIVIGLNKSRVLKTWNAHE